MKCPNGHRAGSDDSFCPTCGEPMTSCQRATETSQSVVSRRQGRLIGLIVAIVVVCVTAGVVVVRGSSDGGSATPTTSDPVAATTTIADSEKLDEARIAWSSVLPSLSAHTVTSDFVLLDGVPTVVTGDGATGGYGNNPLVTIWEFGGGVWTPVMKTVTGLPSANFTFVDATGEGTLDVLVDGAAASTMVAFVFARTGGSWHLIPWGAGRTDSPGGYATVDDQGTITVSTRSCVPSCAQGGRLLTTWIYDQSSDSFLEE